jgi:hypothetical protein
VELVIEPGQSLGLMIRGGTEYNLGIFITGIDKDSVADRSGLMVKLNFNYILCNLIAVKIFFFRLVIKFWK